MNWDIIEGNWGQWKGKVMQEWGKLTDDELTRAKGDREELKGLLQQKYGLAKDEAETKIDEFLAKAS
ncbi:CsbD family protein [Mangrovicoccus ximenensis]|uniref:CsbD family protein n=1 Tax=Mangrovicoccus ximenensis TaxID=1911570 RepID=UPI000D334DBD|nr:CsbD family protein [Mangrovicoccus ximenensis]